MRNAKVAGASQECQVVIFTDVSPSIPSTSITPSSANRDKIVYTAEEDKEFMKVIQEIRGDDSLLAKPVSTDGIDDLRFIFMTSQITFVDSMEELLEQCPDFNLSGKDTESALTLGVKRARGGKCDRCWFYSDSVGSDVEDIHKDVCSRCANVVRSDGYTFDAPVPAAGALPLV